MKSILGTLNAQSAVALAILRVVMGIIFVVWGYGKVFGGGYAIGFFTKAGIPLPEIAGPIVSFMELGGGILLIVGLFTRYVGVLFTIEFIVAAITIANFSDKGIMGTRLEFMMLMGAIILVTHGAGALAIDRPGRRWEP